MQGNNKSGSHKKSKKKSVSGLAKVNLPICIVDALFPYPLLDMFPSESDTEIEVIHCGCIFTYTVEIRFNFWMINKFMYHFAICAGSLLISMFQLLGFTVKVDIFYHL